LRDFLVDLHNSNIGCDLIIARLVMWMWNTQTKKKCGSKFSIYVCFIYVAVVTCFIQCLDAGFDRHWMEHTIINESYKKILVLVRAKFIFTFCMLDVSICLISIKTTFDDDSDDYFNVLFLSRSEVIGATIRWGVVEHSSLKASSIKMFNNFFSLLIF
jgi:hypothetical protein